MITKKNLAAALLAFFILAIMFVTVPIKSSTSVYDPWADVSGPTVGVPDGVINMRDVAYEVSLFNTEGTPINRTDLIARIDSLNASLQLETVYRNENESLLYMEINNLVLSLAQMNTTIIQLQATNANLTSRVSALEVNSSLAIPSNSSYSYNAAQTSEAFNWVDIPDMSVTLTVNRTSNLMILFSTDAYCAVGPQEITRILIQATVNSIPADPNNVTLTPCVQSTGFAFLPSHAHYLSQGAYSYVFNMPALAPGVYTIKIQWQVLYSSPQGTGYAGYRTLTVVALPT
jgi:hypothetical protein